MLKTKAPTANTQRGDSIERHSEPPVDNISHTHQVLRGASRISIVFPHRSGAVLADGSVRLTVPTLRADAGLVMR